MDTVRLVEPGRLERFQSAEPGAPGPGEALVQVRSIGICGNPYRLPMGDADT